MKVIPKHTKLLMIVENYLMSYFKLFSDQILTMSFYVSFFILLMFLFITVLLYLKNMCKSALYFLKKCKAYFLQQFGFKHLHCDFTINLSFLITLSLLSL